MEVCVCARPAGCLPVLSLMTLASPLLLSVDGAEPQAATVSWKATTKTTTAAAASTASL